jgi:putative transposase
MLVPVRSILGLGGVPKDRTSATNWLIKAGVPIVTLEGDARRPEAVALADLPHYVRLELSARHIEAEGLEPGARDEAAHAKLEEATPKMQAKAARLAQLAVFMVKREADGWTKPDIFAAVRKAFGAEGTSEASLWRILRAVRDVAPANFAPALLDDYNMNGRPCGPNWDDAWHYALKKIDAANEEWPMDAAYDRLEAIKAEMGWHLPSRAAFHRRWAALPVSVQLTLRHDEKKAKEILRQSAMRNRGTIAPMDIWSLDGRTLDKWATWEDGTVSRPVELRLVDVGSGKVLASRICKSENAVDTVALILEAVRKYGIPKCIYTDNSRAFAGHLVAGGAAFKFRKRKAQGPLFEPPGVCHHLGIEVRFAKPANGQAKLVERSFAETAKRIDAGPEFAGAHSGSSPGRKP